VKRFLLFIKGDFWDLIKLNLLFCVAALPSIALFILSFISPLGVVALVLSLAAAFPIGGACSACLFCIAALLRGASGDVWHDFLRKLKENIKQASIPGVLYTGFIYLQVFLWQSFTLSDTSIGWLLATALSLLVFGMVAPYVFLQIAYIDLKTSKILTNSLLLSFGNFGRSILGFLCSGIVWFVFLLTFPGSLPFSPLLLILGFSVSWLMTLLCIWPPVNKQFAIEETLNSRHETSDDT
jgi:hypothetical protein